MITSVHAFIYSDDVDATRSFLRDVVGLPFVNDTGTSDGWDQPRHEVAYPLDGAPQPRRRDRDP